MTLNLRKNLNEKAMINKTGYFIFIFPYFVAARDVTAESGKLWLEITFFNIFFTFKVSQKKFAQALYQVQVNLTQTELTKILPGMKF